MFVIEEEPRSTLLRVTLTAFWQVATVQAFAVAMRAAIARLGCGPGEHRILCDVSAWPTQAQETARAFADYIGNTSHAGETRLAVVGASALLQLQITRVAARPTLRLFGDKIEAESWLQGERQGEPLSIQPGSRN